LAAVVAAVAVAEQFSCGMRRVIESHPARIRERPIWMLAVSFSLPLLIARLATHV
jgi:hypothetical protein